MSILIVDDDRELLDLLQFALKRAGLAAVGAVDEPSALRLHETEHPELIVLDLNLGAWNGLDILQQIRRRDQVPVIVLTARDAEEDKVKALEMGADDYVTKPFSPRELIARIRAQLRRAGHGVEDERAGQRMFEVGPLMLDVAAHSVTKAGQPVSLTVTEFRLLHALMAEAGVVVTTRALLRKVWGYDDPEAGDVVRVTVHRLRRKLENDASHPELVHTVAGVGVMLKPT